MSMFLGQPSGGLGCSLVQLTDDRNVQKNFQWDFVGNRANLDPWADGMLWPRAKLLGASLLGMDQQNCGRFESDIFDVCGGSQVKKLIGMTLDSNGDPLGNCLVQGFVTSTDTFVGQTVSDTGGYYELPTSYSGQNHYIVAYKAGSPDVAGTSANTLVPA